MLLLLACKAPTPTDAHPKIAGDPIDDRVIAMIAARDDLSEAEARASVIETLRWAAAARRNGAELDEPRRDHLRRTALARLWLSDIFELTHQPSDIPADDPLIAKARGDRRNVHPEIVEVCHTVFLPEGIDDPVEAERIAADPQWQAKAIVRADAFAEHIRRTVPLDDPDACDIIAQNVELEPKTGDGVLLRLDGRGGYDLEACAETNDDGTCKQSRFVPEWVAVIRHGPIPGLRGPFFTRFGVHVALVSRVIPAAPTEAPALLDHLRDAVHDPWRARELAERLDALRVEKAVQILGSPGAGEAAP